MATATATAPQTTATFEFAHVDNANGFDYYAVWTDNAWLDGQWVRVLEGSNMTKVEDALYRGELVSSL